MFRKSLFVLCGLCLMGFLWVQAACDSGPKPCKLRSECPDPTLYSCVRNFCFLNCRADSDCPNGEKCNTQRVCGVLPDGGTSGDCNPGDVRGCYTASAGCDPEGQQFLCKGTCKAGSQTCNQESKWGACEGEVTPASEICGDGLDNNCDGRVDEDCGVLVCTLGQTRDCYTSAQGCQRDGDKFVCKGRCQPGKQTCQTGADGKPEWAPCDDQILPIPELCNNDLDDNCDGEVNEGCACRVGESRGCTADNGCAGIQSCQARPSGSEWTQCVASAKAPESCDGLDNDCDGKIDNVEGTSDPLTRDCAKLCFKGTETCLEGKFQNCTAEDPIPDGEGEETDATAYCNNRDDDCDGRIDNVKGRDTPILRSCTPSTPTFGPCKDNAYQACEAGQWGTCIAGTPAPAEACNGVDDDCDGTVDESAECPDGTSCKTRVDGQKICAP